MKRVLIIFGIYGILAFSLTTSVDAIEYRAHNSATNFPTPGWPVCSKCGKYHPGQSCPKDSGSRVSITLAYR